MQKPPVRREATKPA